MIGCDFFTCQERTNGRLSIYDNFEFSEELLNKIRGEFVAQVKRQNKRFTEFSIKWIKPEAAIVNKEGKAIDVLPRTENVSNECRCNFVKRIVKWFSLSSKGVS